MTAADISTEDLLNELHKRQHQFSPDEFLSPAQCDYKAKLGVLRSAVVEAWKQNPGNGDLCALLAKCDELDSIYGNPLPARAYAVNTALFGREDRYETHQAEMAR